MASRWRLTLFGGLAAKRDEQVITRFRTQKTGSLLAYLAYYRQRSHPRETLIHLLWPDCDPKRGRDRLSTELVWLRRELDLPSLPRGSVIVADRDTVRLSPDAVITDVAEFKTALRSAQRAGSGDERAELLSHAVERYRGELLPGYYEEWILPERQWLAELYFQASGALLLHLEQRGDFQRALRYARRGIEIDPLREEAHRNLMRLCAAAGQSAAALRQYQTLEQLLMERLGAVPSVATRSLAREIERLTLLRPAGGRALGRSGPRAVPSSDRENRLVTVLVIAAGGSGGMPAKQPPRRSGALGKRLQTILVDVVLKYEGRIDRFLKGGALVVFGVPQVHEDDAERAIRAAIEIQEAGCQLGTGVAAAVNTGEVPVGGAGPEELQEAVLANPVVDLACQLLQQAAPGQILAGEATYRQTRRAFVFAPASSGASEIAQRAEEYRVERALPRPQKPRGIDGLRADLIGRDEELARLQAAYSRALQGEGQMVCIIGEAGVGKSRLVAELRRGTHPSRDRVPTQWVMGAEGAEGSLPSPTAWVPGRGSESGLHWLEGRCLELGMTATYSLWVDLFRDYFAITQGSSNLPDEEGQTRGDRLVACLRQFETRGQLSEERVEEMGPLLGHLLSARFGSDWDERLKNASPEQIRYQTLLAVRDFFLALARSHGADTLQPVVLVCEDLHWADTLSLDLVSLLMEALANVPLLLLCVYRPEQEHRCWHLASIARRKCPERYIELNLRELTPQQSRRMVESLLAVDSLPPAVKELILEKSRGNPFFVEEIIRSLIATGLVYREEGIWRAREGIEAVQVPESVQSVILSRVDRLTPDVKHVLQNASVMGRLFRRRLLEQISDDETDLERALWEMEDRQFIYQERVMPEEEYSFNHVLTQETIYGSLGRRQREALHQKVGEALEALYGDGLDEYYEQLAYHFEQSSADEKAVEYLMKAGEKARRAYLNEAAVGYFQRALERLDQSPLGEARPEGRLEALGGLGRVYHGMGKEPQAEECFRQAIAVGKQMELTPRELVRLYSWLCDVLFWRDRYAEAVRIGEEGLALVGEDTESAEAALMHSVIAYGSMEQGNVQIWREFTRRNVSLLRRLPYAEELRSAHVHVAEVYAYEGRNPEEAVKWFEILEQNAKQFHDSRALWEVYRWTADLWAAMGDLVGAIAREQQALELATKIGDAKLRSWSLGGMVRYHLVLGNVDKAREYTAASLEVRENIGSKSDLADTLRSLAEIAICHGCWEEATDALRKARRFSQEIGGSGVWETLWLGRVCLAQGKRREASEHFLKAIPVAGRFFVDALCGLEEASDDAEAFRSFCRSCRKACPKAAEGLLVRWVLEPIRPVFLPRPLVNEAFAEPLPSEWVWHDPFGDCSFTVQSGMRIDAENGRDLWHLNLSAPRLLRPTAGAFAVQTVCAPGSPEQPVIGGLLLWKGEANYLRLDRGTRGPYEISFQGCLGNKGVIIGRGRLPAERVSLRLERLGSRVNALCSADGERWFTVGHTEFTDEDPVEVGLHAIGMIDRTIYPGAYPEGTAIRFESFQLWRSEQPG